MSVRQQSQSELASASSSATTSPTTNYYAAMVSPIHQRFIDIESRLKRWPIFKHLVGRGKRSTSVEQSYSARTPHEHLGKESSRSPSYPLTCPVPRRSRKQLYMNYSSGTMRPQLKLDPVCSSVESPVPDDVEQLDKSGLLNINGTHFAGVELKDLIQVEQLGDGSFGQVSKYKYKSRALAVKHIKRTDNPQEKKKVFMDLGVISKCSDCPYIVKYFGYIIDFDYVHICMEVMATCLDRLLAARVKSRPATRVGFPEEVIGKIALSVVRALNYLKEKHHIMHRDVKPSNILLDFYGNFKLCDFGISGVLVESKAVTRTGCTAYLAPERINSEKYDIRADVWSLGITLVELAKGKFPYDYKTAFDLMIKIQTEDPPILWPEKDGFSPEFCQFITDCLQKDFNYRPKYKELMEKPFLRIAHTSDADTSLWFNSPEEYEGQHGRS